MEGRETAKRRITRDSEDYGTFFSFLGRGTKLGPACAFLGSAAWLV